MDTVPSTQELTMAPEIAATLARVRVGLIGFEPAEEVRISDLLQRAHLMATHFDATWVGGAARLGDLLMVRLEGLDGERLRAIALAPVPVLIAAPGEAVLQGAWGAYSWARDFLPEPWSDADLVLRLFRLLVPPPQCAVSADRTQPLILIADDDLAWIPLVEAALRAHGLAFQVATDGLTTLRLARQLLPDLLVLDVRMPAMDGFEVLETIRREPLLQHLPVALLTGCDDATEVKRGSELGADDYLVKPIGPTVLVNRIKRLLATASRRPDLMVSTSFAAGASRQSSAT